MSEYGEPRCRLCGAPDSEVRASSGNHKVSYLFCPACGYIGLAPSHFLTEIEEVQRYLLHRNSASDKGYLAYLKCFIEQALAPYVPRGSRVLDFGSGPSPVLFSELVSVGFKCKNYDPFFNPGLSWKTKHYHAIVLHEVVEHLRDPRNTLLGLVPLLEPDGILAIRSRFSPSTLDAFHSWWYKMDSTHVGFFTPASLEKLLIPAGFHTVTCIQPDIIVFRRT